MAYICDICGKHTTVGRSQQHKRGVAGKRWRKKTTSTKRLFKPNVQKVSFMENGKRVTYRICAKCLKRKKRDMASNYLSA